MFTQILFAVVSSYALWRILKSFVTKSTFPNIPGPPNPSWLTGNFGQIFDNYGWDFHRDLTERYGSAPKIHGLLGDEQLFVADPLALHHILIKDEQYYEQTGLFIIGNYLIFGDCLISSLGEHHKKQRKMLNPLFSIKHLRDLYPIFDSILIQLRNVLAGSITSGKDEVDVMKWMSRAALECIGQGGLGYTFDALDDTKKNRYSEAVKMLIPHGFKLMVFRALLPYLVKLGPVSFRRKLWEWAPFPNLQKMREIVDIMHEQSTEIFNAKKVAVEKGEEAMSQEVGMGKDITSTLLKANMNADAQDRLPDDEVLAQMNMFLFAAHDTTTISATRMFHQLAIHKDVQNKVRDEIRAVKAKFGKVDYDALSELPYVEAVVRETLRMYPPACLASRVTRRDIVLPLLWPMKSADGKTTITEIPLRKDQEVMISILNVNQSKAIWGEDAEEWKPDRWMSSLPDSVASARVPSLYASIMTFIAGPRGCIGFKFAEVELKIMLINLLDTLEFSLGSKEIYWNLGTLQTPVLKGVDDITPQLPLKISFAT